MTENQHDPRARQFGRQGVAPLSLDIYQLWSSFRRPIQADFRFDPDDPLVVTVAFLPKDEPPVMWRVCRQLLYSGLVENSGIGDVQVWPVRIRQRWVVRIRLQARGMSALFEADRQCLEDWLHDTDAAVPMGEELNSLDWDAATSYLLGGS
ncbi:SsgA family sporulation/cell division regulator [Streptomyces sp. NBC_01717]|uniref:SsgA family sporulation/cell division regulator n=1 Tax=Streptomyces sp. NBC_01717 TaxID=2975918 RepID=UPI002E368F18|nr:SsgA family sporulation/cell division regulator [Streptomyces sp. NBC_01717]